MQQQRREPPRQLEWRKFYSQQHAYYGELLIARVYRSVRGGHINRWVCVTEAPATTSRHMTKIQAKLAAQEQFKIFLKSIGR